VQIEWVHLVDFRSYRSLSFVPGSALNVLTGANGQGKTNLLEGLGVLLAGRSFRGARLGEMVRWDQEAARVAGEVSRGQVGRTIRRSIETRDDGGWGLSGEGCPWVRAVPFGWQDLAVVAGGPQARRSFLDGLAAKLFPAHGRAWARYRQVLARRNHLLQAGMAERELAARLEPWNEQLAQLAVEVRERRAQAVAALCLELARLHRDVTGGGSVAVSCRALAQTTDAMAVRALLASRLRDEMRRGQTLEGPHRDEVEISLGERDARSFASRGQQRAMALALRLAEARAVARALGSPPVLLLDDALSELDGPTQERAMEEISGAGQVFLTTAARDVAVGGGAAWWDVGGGGVTQRSLGRVRGAA
jgi:DNA replication and repair protein RecF